MRALRSAAQILMVIPPLRLAHRVRPLLSLAAALTALLAGCASLQNTPIQEYVWEMAHKCEHVNPAWVLDRVEPDGRYWIRGQNATSAADFQQCMQEQIKLHPPKESLAANQKPAQAVAKGGEAARPSTPTSVGATAATPTQPLSISATVPTWKPGDEWGYRWDSPRGKGTFVWSVDREETLDGAAYYVIKSGTTREIYFRKSDLAYYMDTVNGQVERRHTPPSAYAPWLFTPGAKWELRYVRERPLDRQTEELVLACELLTAEPVSVPAGTFDTVKVVCRNRRTDAVSFETWYSLAVKQMVRERTYFSYGIRERELTVFKVR